MTTLRSLVIDSAGGIWRHPADAALRNADPIRLRISAAAIRIGLPRGRLTRAAFEAAVHCLAANASERFVIETPNRTELIPDLEDAVARLSERADGPARRDFFCEDVSFERLRQPRLAPLAAMLQRWRHSGGDARQSLPRAMADPCLRGRTLSIRMDGDWHGVLAHIGDGFTWLPAHWRRGMIGQAPSRQPDPIYWQRAAAEYSIVDRMQAPRLQLVEALIHVPDAPARRSRYERLLLPWHDGDRRFVSVGSVLRTSFACGGDEDRPLAMDAAPLR